MDEATKCRRMLEQLNECLTVLRQLENQLNENEVSFNKAFEGSVRKNYHDENVLAQEACEKLKRKINKLQEEVKVRLATTMQ